MNNRITDVYIKPITTKFFGKMLFHNITLMMIMIISNDGDDVDDNDEDDDEDDGDGDDDDDDDDGDNDDVTSYCIKTSIITEKSLSSS